LTSLRAISYYNTVLANWPDKKRRNHNMAKQKTTSRVYDIRTSRRVAVTKPVSAADFQPSAAAAEIIAIRQRRKAIDALWATLDTLEKDYKASGDRRSQIDRAKLNALWVSMAEFERNYQDDLQELA
jgi:hypothetical protein